MDSKEIIAAFGPSESLTDEVIEKINTLKQIFQLSTDDIFVRWETYNVNEVQNDLDLNTVNLEGFQEYLQKDLSNQTRATPSIKKAKDFGSIKRKPLLPINSSSPIETPNKYRKLGETPFKTPGTHLKLDSSPADNYHTANNTFQRSPVNHLSSSPTKPDSNSIIETLNGHIDEISNDYETDSKFKIATNFDAAKYKFRAMSMKLLESADMLDEQIDSVASLYQEVHKDTQFGNPCLPAQFDITCCGRIVPDSPLYDKLFNQDLNATSLFLETSRLSGIGQRVSLDLSNLKEYSLFPGQIVCLEGKNPTGRAFIVDKILELPELGAPVTPAEELKEISEGFRGADGLKFVIACGPFSNSSNLNYSKFEEFINRINNEIKPDLVILCGPFVDLNNKSVIDGEIELPHEKVQPTNLDEVFKKTITPILKKLNSKIQVILIPSLRDATISHCSYPQDSFDRKALGLPKNVKVFPNPNGFSINEIVFGCSNLDVFKDLKDVSKIESSSKILSNRFERIINHIFDQRRYYPTFPGSVVRKPCNDKTIVESLDGSMAKELSETKIGGSSLEVSYMGLAELGDSLPDVLISPSELKYFAKVVKNVIVINPGSFIRPYKDDSRQEGTYVVMNTKVPDLEDSDNVEAIDNDLNLYYHNVFKRSRIDIYKS